MKEIHIFSAIWDRNFDSLISKIKSVLQEEEMIDKVSVKVFDVDNKKNKEQFEKFIRIIEKRSSNTANPVKAVPLVVIDNKPFSLGVSPEFKKDLLAVL